jgi:hypothetical protein
MFPYESKTEAVQDFVSHAVAGGVAKLTAQQIVERTDLEKDALRVQIASHAIGQYAAHKLRPVTDACVDATIERYRTWRKNRKQETTEE